MLDPQQRHRALHRAALAGLSAALALGAAGCKSKSAQVAQIAAADQTGQDPADANMAAPYTGGTTGGYTGGQPASARVLGQSASLHTQSSGESYETQQAAPIIRQAPSAAQPEQYYPVPQAGNGNASYSNAPGYDDQQAYNQGYDDAEEAGEQAIAETDQAPPPLPEYDQPPAPEDNYIWTPGYWNYASTGYYWVPGVWCAPPFYGALWTPPYWGYSNNHYLFHRGYWGQHVGYYGGVNYGFGYIGTGYFGGYWHNRDFFYNRAVTNVNVTNIHNVYNRTVIYDNRVYGPRSNDHVSFNGGRGGLNVQPRPFEVAAMHEAHYAPVPAQRENRLAAASNRAQFFSNDHGHPANAFRAQPVGALNRIAAAPERQPFNQPGANGPDTRSSDPAAFSGRNRAGSPLGAPGHPGAASQPNAPRGLQPNSVTNRPATPGNSPANSRPEDFNRTVSGPATAAARPGDTRNGNRQPQAEGNRNQSTAPFGNRGTQTENRGERNGFNRSAIPGQPASAPNHVAAPARTAVPATPTAPLNTPRAGNFHRDVQPGTQFGSQSGARNGTQPGAQPFTRPNAEPTRPQVQPNRPASEPQRQAPEQNRPASGFTPRPQSQPAVQRPATPAPHVEASRPAPAATPHNGGGEGHHH